MKEFTPKYFDYNGQHVAVVFKAGSSAIGRALKFALHPTFTLNPNRGQEYLDKMNNRAGWQAGVPRANTPIETIIPVRDPVERFRSACAQEGKTADEALNAESLSNHFRHTSEWLVDGAKLYKFPEHIDDIAIDLGLDEIASVNDSATNNGPKPELTPTQIEAVQALYADDIALYESITEAGQVYTAPPAPATEELKAAKIQELKAERDAAWQGTLMTSFGVPFHTDVQTQIDIQMMLQMLDPLEVFSGYKCADGIRRSISREQFALALNEGVVRKVTAYAVEGAKLEAVAAATTAEELAAI